MLAFFVLLHKCTLQLSNTWLFYVTKSGISINTTKNSTNALSHSVAVDNYFRVFDDYQYQYYFLISVGDDDCYSVFFHRTMRNAPLSSWVRRRRRLICLLYHTMMSVSLLFLPNSNKCCFIFIAKKSFQTWKFSSVRLWCSAIYISSKLHIIISSPLLAIPDLYFQSTFIYALNWFLYNFSI
jgi:hypothetical protein